MVWTGGPAFELFVVHGVQEVTEAAVEGVGDVFVADEVDDAVGLFQRARHDVPVLASGCGVRDVGDHAAAAGGAEVHGQSVGEVVGGEFVEKFRRWLPTLWWVGDAEA